MKKISEGRLAIRSNLYVLHDTSFPDMNEVLGLVLYGGFFLGSNYQLSTILKHLTNITTSIEVNPHGFTTYFHFSPNEYFTNAVLKIIEEEDILWKLSLMQRIILVLTLDARTVCSDTIQWNEARIITKNFVKKNLKKGPTLGKFMTKTSRPIAFSTSLIRLSLQPRI
ncbi:unnamed protein product [Cylicocyclus nassatus]|uniref:Uncharacterized protein n=1 Tax=Cylicocyclus nassatus TaxID=53992 RepID=A0AA36HE38_CYLNA|nr:unnamed protein product [Cylicocyclus nassatus]